jgi:hypothetical protein
VRHLTSVPPRRCGPRGLLAAVLLVGLALPLLAAGCTDDAATPMTAVPAAGATAPAAPLPLEGEDTLNLTVYLRAGQGVAAHLVPVTREVAVGEDLPRRAVELLLAGPVTDDPDLEPVLPPSTKVLDLAVEGGTATVRLSAHVLRDAGAVGATPTNEALALAALANTLTEFPSIDRVALAIDGDPADAERFWGGWGLPEVLVRDETLVGGPPGEAEGVVDLGRFSAEAQEIGTSAAPPVRITSIRVRDRITHTRFVIELADAGSQTAGPKVPPAKVRRANDDVVVLLSGIAALDGDAAETVRLDVDPGHFRSARHDLDELAGTLRLVLTPTEPRAWWLHTLANPTRVVLDVRK